MFARGEVIAKTLRTLEESCDFHDFRPLILLSKFRKPLLVAFMKSWFGKRPPFKNQGFWIMLSLNRKNTIGVNKNKCKHKSPPRHFDALVCVLYFEYNMCEGEILKARCNVGGGVCVFARS